MAKISKRGLFNTKPSKEIILPKSYFHCPNCDSNDALKVIRLRYGLWHCMDCKKDFLVDGDREKY